MSSGNYLYALKTKVIIISLFKSEHHMNEVFACLRNISYPLLRIADSDHRFMWMNADRADLFQFIYKMVKQHQSMC